MNGAPVPAWSPSPEVIDNSNLTAFTRWLEERTGRKFPDYGSLWKWSVEDPDSFWQAI